MNEIYFRSFFFHPTRPGPATNNKNTSTRRRARKRRKRKTIFRLFTIFLLSSEWLVKLFRFFFFFFFPSSVLSCTKAEKKHFRKNIGAKRLRTRKLKLIKVFLESFLLKSCKMTWEKKKKKTNNNTDSHRLEHVNALSAVVVFSSLHTLTQRQRRSSLLYTH